MRDDPGLAAARAGDDQGRAFQVADDALLLRVQRAGGLGGFLRNGGAEGGHGGAGIGCLEWASMAHRNTLPRPRRRLKRAGLALFQPVSFPGEVNKGRKSPAKGVFRMVACSDGLAPNR